MLTTKAIEIIYSQGQGVCTKILVQIVSVRVLKIGYDLEISDGSYYCKILYLSHTPIPLPNLIISIEDFEVLTSPLLIIISSFTIVQSSPLIGKPEKFITSAIYQPPSTFNLIKLLTHNSTGWIIKVRLIKKEVINYNECRKSSSFKVLFLDEGDGTLQGYFTNQFVDKFYHALMESKLYLVAGGTIRKSVKSFKGHNSGVYLIVDESTKITEIYDDKTVKLDLYNLISIKSLCKVNYSTRVDTYGLVVSSQNSGFITVEIQDLSKSTIQLFCGNFESVIPRYSVIVCKNVQYESISGILISDSDSKILVNPTEFPEVLTLQEWTNSQTLAKHALYTISEIYEVIKGNYIPEEIELIGSISWVINTDLRPFWYPACNNVEKCQKKVVSHSNGFYFCGDCNENFQKFSYRFCVGLSIWDSTGKINVKAFDNIAKVVFETSAEELVMLSYNDESKFDSVIGNVIGRQVGITVLGKQVGKSIPIYKFRWINASPVNKTIVSEVREGVST